MKRNNIPEAIGIFISLCGVTVMIGWFLGIEVLKSILPVWVSMKFTTALSFFLCGIALYFTARFQKKDRELGVIIIPIMSMVVLILMVSLLASMIIGVNVGVEDMFIKDSIRGVGTITPGRPAIPTMISFILIALSGILTTMDIKRLNKIPHIVGMIVAIIGLMVILGYSINQPLLTFAVSGKFSAMSLHSAILFVLWGVGVVLIEKNK